MILTSSTTLCACRTFKVLGTLTTSAPSATCQADYEWPSVTKVVLFLGTNKVMLTIQSLLIHSIFQDAFEHLQVSLLFIYAFPDPALTCSMISEALGIAAQSYLPRAVTTRHQLKLDKEYLSRICHLVSSSLVISNCVN